jgi:hypothetical protein
MPKIDQSLLGCVLSQRFAEETDQRMADAGIKVEFRVGQSQFNGRWETLKSRGIQGVFLWQLGEKFRQYKPHGQRRGTCVGRGAHKALEASYLHSLGNKLAVGSPVEIAWEPQYVGSRIVVGKGQLGSGDGSCGPWMAEFLAGINNVGGFAQRGQYGAADLTKDNESWAVSFSSKNQRMPDELLKELQQHTCSVHSTRSNDQIADAIASYSGIFRCWDTLFGARDKNGQCVASDTGAHCQAVLGVYVDQDGEDSFVDAQSWGANMPSGPDEITLKDGTKVKLPPGMYGVKEREFIKAQRKSPWWDAHAVCVRPGQEYRLSGGSGSRSVSEMERLAS